MKHLLRAAAFATVLSGCALTPRKPFVPSAPPPNTGAVYFYRPSEMTGRLISPTITANGARLGRLGNDSYGVAYLAPGATRVESSWPGIPGSRRDDTAALDVEAGRVYYFRVRLQVGKPNHPFAGIPGAKALVFEDRVGLELVPENEAVPQMAGMSAAEKFGAPAQ